MEKGGRGGKGEERKRTEVGKRKKGKREKRFKIRGRRKRGWRRRITDGGRGGKLGREEGGKRIERLRKYRGREGRDIQ